RAVERARVLADDSLPLASRFGHGNRLRLRLRFRRPGVPKKQRDSSKRERGGSGNDYVHEKSPWRGMGNVGESLNQLTLVSAEQRERLRARRSLGDTHLLEGVYRLFQQVRAGLLIFVHGL